MKKIYKSIEELIGNTPLLELTHIEKELGLKAHILAKLEFLNPAGSIKDRPAYQMILDAEENGILKKGSTIIEPTSGNTGIGLACVAASRGYKCIIVMPSTMSAERVTMMKAYGAEVVLSDGTKGMDGAVKLAEKLQSENPGSIIAGQFVNPSNPKAHILTTGPELYNDTDGEIDYVVAGIGTGGTITGLGKYLKDKIPNIKMIGVEPESSPLLTKGNAGAHKIQGIGANFIPDILDRNVIDQVVAIKNEDAFEYGKMLGAKEGFLCGISSGAALKAAVDLAKLPQNEGKNIVVILPDSGDRYLTTELFK